MRTTVQRTLDAECRAVAEGHRCRFDASRLIFLVKSDTSDRTYELTAKAVGSLLVVSCTCPAGVKGRQVPAGSLCCKHAAICARRLLRAGLVRWDGGHWYSTGYADSFATDISASEVPAA